MSDIETVDLELILADIEMLRRRQDKAEKNAKSGDKKFKKEAEVLGRLIEWMDGGRSARSFEADEEEREIVAASDLLTNKPIIYAANLDEDGFSAGAENNAYYRQVKALADAEGSRVLPVCARFEQEIAELDEEERAVFMAKNRSILKDLKAVTCNDMLTVLKSMDQDLLKATVAGEKFQEYFFANATDEGIREYLKGVLSA